VLVPSRPRKVPERCAVEPDDGPRTFECRRGQRLGGRIPGDRRARRSRRTRRVTAMPSARRLATRARPMRPEAPDDDAPLGARWVVLRQASPRA
jgi:hypothetical protein